MKKFTILFLLSVLIGGLSSSCVKKPEACFQVSATSINVGEKVTFTNCSSDATEYYWDFGDNVTSTNQNPTHSYSNAGNYTINLKAFSKNRNKSDQISKSVTIIEIIPKSGNWSGSNISFTVVENPLRVSDLKFTYSGTVNNQYCNATYTSTVNFNTTNIGIEHSEFNYSSSSYVINGIFTSDESAEIDISWTEHDYYCGDYSGSKSYTAFFNTKK